MRYLVFMLGMIFASISFGATFAGSGKIIKDAETIKIDNRDSFDESLYALPLGLSPLEYYQRLGLSKEEAEAAVRMRNQLIVHEGRLKKYYLDPLGLMTVGVGHYIESGDPASDRVIEMFLLEDTINARNDAINILGKNYYLQLNEVRRRVLVDMSFNLGKTRFAGFKNTLQAVREQRFDDAAKGMQDSKWCKQTKQRCDNLVKMMKTGKDVLKL